MSRLVASASLCGCLNGNIQALLFQAAHLQITCNNNRNVVIFSRENVPSSIGRPGLCRSPSSEQQPSAPAPMTKKRNSYLCLRNPVSWWFPLEPGQCSDSFLFVIKNLQCSHLLNPHRRVSDSHSRLCVGECECCFSGL